MRPCRIKTPGWKNPRQVGWPNFQAINPNRDRGRPHGRSPPTPPCVRVRTRRFGWLSERMPAGLSASRSSETCKTLAGVVGASPASLLAQLPGRDNCSRPPRSKRLLATPFTPLREDRSGLPGCHGLGTPRPFLSFRMSVPRVAPTPVLRLLLTPAPRSGCLTASSVRNSGHGAGLPR